MALAKLTDIQKIARDCYTGNVEKYSKNAANDVLRAEIIERVGGEWNYTNFQKNKWDVYALLQEINTYGTKEYPNTISKDVVLNSPNVTQEAIDLAHSYGMRVMVFTINTVNSAQHFFRMGVDICASDCLSDDNCILW